MSFMVLLQVAIHQAMKLRAMRAKAALSTGKDAEKGSAGLQQPLTADASSAGAAAAAVDAQPFSNFRYASYLKYATEEMQRVKGCSSSAESVSVSRTPRLLLRKGLKHALVEEK